MTIAIFVYICLANFLAVLQVLALGSVRLLLAHIILFRLAHSMRCWVLYLGLSES